MLLEDKPTGCLYGTTCRAGDDASCGPLFQLLPTDPKREFSNIYGFDGADAACNPRTQLRPGPTGADFIGGTSGGAGTLFQLTETGGVSSGSIRARALFMALGIMVREGG